MEAAIERLVDERGALSVTCVPYLLFPGLILKRNVLGELTRLQRKYPRFAHGCDAALGSGRPGSSGRRRAGPGSLDQNTRQRAMITYGNPNPKVRDYSSLNHILLIIFAHPCRTEIYSWEARHFR